MKRRALALVPLGLLMAGCDRLPGAKQQEPAAAANDAGADKPIPQAPGTTPMNERVATLGILNKRNGISRDFKLRPGQAIRFKDVIVRLRACEKTPPWEFDQLTGAFVQVDVQQTDGSFDRVFSGWLYKESPSLNVVEHRVYDVWPKACEMNFPAAAESAGAVSDDNASSSAPQSGRGGAADERSASPSNPT
ncbi:DUF2155 domain-containing protein [Sphingomonas rosea]|uniref:DUF2155 domain-containing protein n=1 Tax=Sphingomonas rosea TaxID=335605 RepID=A0ABP7U3T7_9SPHN